MGKLNNIHLALVLVILFCLNSVFDLDNLTIPTTINGLRTVIPSHMPVQLNPMPRKIKELPGYVPLATCGFHIYVLASYDQKVAACEYISATGPPAPPSPSVFLFTTSNLMLSFVTPLQALEHAQISHVAIFCFGMKCQHHMDLFTTLPPPIGETPAIRRYNIGCNQQLSGIPLFSLTSGAVGQVSNSTVKKFVISQRLIL